MTSSSHSQVQGLGTLQEEISRLPDPSHQESTSFRILAAVGKGTLYVVGSTVLSPVLLSGAIVVAIYILGRETVLWTIAASTGTLEDYRRKRRKRWTMGGGRCGTCRVNAERNAKKRAAAAETYRKEHGMNTK